MPTRPDDPARPGTGSLEHDPRKWLALAVLLLAQVMIILDAVIVQVALPAAQRDLHIPATSVQWVVTAYLLPFGGLLLLGGRIADDTGRRRAFLFATVGFALASAVGGAASSETMLFAARGVQGLFAAVMAPALLSMLSLGFPSGRDRSLAFSLYAVVGAAGGAIGFVIGGLLTQYLSWRWCLLINLPASGLVLIGSRLLAESRAETNRGYDVVGAVSATLGMLGVIYGVSNAASHGWGAVGTVGPLICGVTILVAFIGWERRAIHPLLPLALLRDRARAAGLLAVCATYSAPTGALLLTLILLQGPQHKSPVTAGLEYLPGPIVAGLAAAVLLKLMPRVPARLVLLGGGLLTACALAAMTRINIHSSYVGVLVPAFALLGAGPTTLYLAGNTIALADVPGHESGLVSAMINTTQQVGAALGVALLATVAASSARHYVSLRGPSAANQAIVHGDHSAFILGAVLMVAMAIALLLLTPANRTPVDNLTD